MTGIPSRIFLLGYAYCRWFDDQIDAPEATAEANEAFVAG
jgi:hypothetical protein